MSVYFERKFSGCMFWKTVFWMYVLGDSFVNVSFGRQFSGCMFWAAVF